VRGGTCAARAVRYQTHEGGSERAGNTGAGAGLRFVDAPEDPSLADASRTPGWNEVR
jgi:hypothetical protein